MAGLPGRPALLLAFAFRVDSQNKSLSAAMYQATLIVSCAC